MAVATATEKIHPSKRDTWLMAVLVIAGLSSLSAALVVPPGEPSSGLALFSLLAAVDAFVLWIFVRTFYVVTGTDLLVRSGPFRWTIPLNDILQVHPTSNPLSSPALSLDRLEIHHARGELMVSPEDKRAFLEDLVARTPGLVLRGDGAVRSG